MKAIWNVATIDTECKSGLHASRQEATIAEGQPYALIGGGRLIRARSCAEQLGYEFDAETVNGINTRRQARELDRAVQPAMLGTAPRHGVGILMPEPGTAYPRRPRRRGRRHAAPSASRPTPKDPKALAAGRDDD